MENSRRNINCTRWQPTCVVKRPWSVSPSNPSLAHKLAPWSHFYQNLLHTAFNHKQQAILSLPKNWHAMLTRGTQIKAPFHHILPLLAPVAQHHYQKLNGTLYMPNVRCPKASRQYSNVV